MMNVELVPPEGGFDVSVETGVRCGRVAAIILAADMALTLISMTLTSFIMDNMSYDIRRSLLSVLGLGEVLAALAFLALILIFMASGVLAVKGARGYLTVFQGLCLSAASGAIAGAMASAVLVMGTVILKLFTMPQDGYITMFTRFSPDSFFGMLMWLPVIALLAIVAGIGYGGIARKFKKLY